jgi:hypothetical protein
MSNKVALSRFAEFPEGVKFFTTQCSAYFFYRKHAGASSDGNNDGTDKFPQLRSEQSTKPIHHNKSLEMEPIFPNGIDRRIGIAENTLNASTWQAGRHQASRLHIHSTASSGNMTSVWPSCDQQRAFEVVALPVCS